MKNLCINRGSLWETDVLSEVVRNLGNIWGSLWET